MPTIFYNKYTNGDKDLTYTESDRKDISYYILRDYWLEEFKEIVNMSIEEVKKLIDKII
jgi:uncharacterized protein YnzC (UPF0291/DUF896 family)